MRKLSIRARKSNFLIIFKVSQKWKYASGTDSYAQRTNQHFSCGCYFLVFVPSIWETRGFTGAYIRASFLSSSSSDILKKEMFNPETWHYPEKYYLCNSLHQTSCVLNLACRDPINVLKIFVLEKRLGNEAKLLINAAIWFLCSIFFF